MRPPGTRRMSAPLLQQQQTPYVSTYQNEWGDTGEQVESELASQADEVEKSQAENIPVAAAHGLRFPPAFPVPPPRMSVNQSRFPNSGATATVRSNPPFVHNGGVRAHLTGNIRQPGGSTYVPASPVGSVQGSQHQQAFRPCGPGAPVGAVQFPFRPGGQISRAVGPGLPSSQCGLTAQASSAVLSNSVQPTLVEENWKEKFLELQKQHYTETGELKMLRDGRDALAAEVNRYRREKDESADAANRRASEAEERARNAEQKAKDGRVFLEREKAELSEKLRRVEAERQAEIDADIAARNSELPFPAPPPKRAMGSEQDTDGFLTADLFMRSGKKKMRVLSPGASSHVSPHTAAPSPSGPVKKETVTRTVQTDPVNELVRRTRSADSIPPVVYQRDLAKERKLRAYEMIHSLNDSRPVADEQFSLSVLLQPVVNFEPHLALAKCPANKRHLDRIPRQVFKKAMKQFARNSSEVCVPLHLLAQEAVALFLVWRRDKSNGHDQYAHWLAVMVPVLADHLRQYVTVVRNLSGFHAECVGKSKTAELFTVESEASLSSYFLKVIKCASQPALHYLASLEDNARLALVVMRKLLDLFPDISRYYLRDNVAVQVEQAEDGNTKPQQQTEEQPGTAGFQCRLIDRLASGYRLDSVTADAALKGFARVEGLFKLVSPFRLLLTLMDPLQLKMCRKDIMAMAASTITSLAKSVDPAGRQRQVLSTGLSTDVLLNYLSVADSPDQLSSLLDLLGISLRWKQYAVQKCSGENESCLWWNLYANVLVIPETKKRDVVGNALIHGQLLSLLLGIIFSDDVEITQLLLAPTRHCVELLTTQLAEILYTYVTSLSAAALHSQPALEVFPAAHEFVHSAVLWLYGMKKLMKSYVWNSATRDVAHYLEAVVIILHSERLFEYDQDFDVVLNNFYDEIISNSLARITGSEESAGVSSRDS